MVKPCSNSTRKVPPGGSSFGLRVISMCISKRVWLARTLCNRRLLTRACRGRRMRIPCCRPRRPSVAIHRQLPKEMTRACRAIYKSARDSHGKICVAYRKQVIDIDIDAHFLTRIPPRRTRSRRRNPRALRVKRRRHLPYLSFSLSARS